MSNTSVRIRLATADDVGAVLALLRAHGSGRRSTDDDEAIASAIRSRAVLVASAGGALVGAVVAGFDGWRGNMYRLTVDAAHRRQGLATALVRTAEHQLGGLGCHRITVLFDTDDPSATAFWSSVGYTADPHLTRAFKNLPPP